MDNGGDTAEQHVLAGDVASPQESEAIRGQREAELIAAPAGTIDSGATSVIDEQTSILPSSRGTAMTAPKGPRVSEIAATTIPEATSTIAGVNTSGLPPTGAGAAAGSPESVIEELADSVQTASAAIGSFDFTEQWHELLVQAQSTGDEVIHLAARTGPMAWLAGGGLLIIATEIVRLRRERSLKNLTIAGWWEVTAPSGLA
jgi:hypothetical protein